MAGCEEFRVVLDIFALHNDTRSYVFHFYRTDEKAGIGVASVCVNLYIQEMVPSKVRGCLGSLAPFLGSALSEFSMFDITLI